MHIDDIDRLRAEDIAHARRRYNHLSVGPSSTGLENPRTDPKPDPWIKVGTTTIDGTIAQVGGMLRVLTIHDDEEAIDAFMKADEPWKVGGRWLRARGSHINSHTGTALVRCDIVRRQSEIDAEHAAKVAEAFHRDDSYALPACPECGPHGNRGEVLLAESWAKCTTCNGGKAGDLWGAVEVEMEVDVDISAWPTSHVPTAAQIYESYRADIAACLRVPKDILFGEQPSGFQIPTAAEQREYMDRRFGHKRSL